jgi:hypothetical protein
MRNISVKSSEPATQPHFTLTLCTSKEKRLMVVISLFCHLDAVYRQGKWLQVGIGKQFDSILVSVSELNGLKLGA